jgi:hypothetical protein
VTQSTELTGNLATTLKFINKLHQHENCTEYIHDLLDMIENNMLVVATEAADPRRMRKSCMWVSKKLADMHAKCKADCDGYATAKNPWRELTRSRPRDPMTINTSANFARIWKYCHLFQSNLGYSRL